MKIRSVSALEDELKTFNQPHTANNLKMLF